MAKYIAGIRERKKAETRDHLAQATVDLIMSEGFEGATIAAISERANVSSRTFHNYFPHRDAAIKHYLDQLIEELVEECGNLPQGLHPVDAMRTLTTNFRCKHEAREKPFDRFETLYFGARNSPHLNVEAESFIGMQKVAGAFSRYTAGQIDPTEAYLLLHASIGLVMAVELTERNQPDLSEEESKNLLNSAYETLKRGFSS